MWLTVSAVGFLTVTALVIVLARGSTARWEREKRAARAARRADVGSFHLPDGAAGRLRGALVRTVAAARRMAAPVGRPLKRVTGVLATAPKQLRTGVPPVRQLLGMGRSGGHRAEVEDDRPPSGAAESAADERGDGTRSPVPARIRGLQRVRRRPPRPRRRRTLPFLARRNSGREPRMPLVGSGELGPAPAPGAGADDHSRLG